MRIRKEFAKKGLFWLPSNPDKKIPGTLTITDGGDIELEECREVVMGDRNEGWC